MIAQGRSHPHGRYIDDALYLLDRLLQAAEAGARKGAVIQARILQALSLDATRDRRAALAELAPAIR